MRAFDAMKRADSAILTNIASVVPTFLGFAPHGTERPYCVVRKNDLSVVINDMSGNALQLGGSYTFDVITKDVEAGLALAEQINMVLSDVLQTYAVVGLSWVYDYDAPDLVNPASVLAISAEVTVAVNDVFTERK